MGKVINVQMDEDFYNEIIQGGGSSGESSGSDIEANAEYYRIDWDKAKELGYDENDNSMYSITGMFNLFLGGTYLFKLNAYNSILISPTGVAIVNNYIKYATHICFIPIKSYNPDGWSNFNSFTQLIENSVLPPYKEIPFTDCFIPITKEEFYAV